MFLCEACLKKDACKIPFAFHNHSVGKCEDCGKTAVCADCRPSHVVKPNA